MRRRILWQLAGLALWLTISLILQGLGASLLSAHLIAAVLAFAIVAVATGVRRRRT